MDILDNIIYANLFSSLRPIPPGNNFIISDYVAPFVPVAGRLPMSNGSAVAPLFSYGLPEKMDFCSYPDSVDIEKSIQRHWFDVNEQVSYDTGGVTAL